MLISVTVLMAELLNACMAWWKSGIYIKMVFLTLFVLQLIWVVKLAAVNYQASIQAKKLKEELKHVKTYLKL